MDMFKSLLDATYAKVFYHTLKQVKNNHDAADITQNTFFKALIHLNKVKKPASLQPWLFTICNNEIKQFYRNQGKIPAHQEPHVAENYEELYTAIELLTGTQRQIVLLKYFGGYTMQELAVVLSISPSTVKSRLYEARQTLKRHLNTPGLKPSLQKERRNTLMATLNLCAIGAETIPCMSLHAQKQLLECARGNMKFNPNVLAELANIPSGQKFMDACSGKLSYEELLHILACCDDSLLYRLGGIQFGTWRNAIGNPFLEDIMKLYKTGGYVDSIEPIIYVKSIRETCEWYKKYLNWSDGTTDDCDEIDKWGHAAISPYAPGGTHNNFGHFKGFHLRCGGTGEITNSRFFIFVSGLVGLRADIVERGWDKISEITHNAWGTKSFSLTDINGFVMEFCEWSC